MHRTVLLVLALLMASIAAAGLREPAPPPPLPKDTLPPKLIVEKLPQGLDAQPVVPADNPQTEAKAQLGRTLFFDPRLSADKTIACASCHDPGHGFAGKEPKAIGIRGKQGRRNAPSLFNRAFGTAFFWDGRESSLEVQALKPIEDPAEMGATVPEIVARLQEDQDYVKRFKEVFPDGVTGPNIGKAIAAFERTLLLGNSRIDKFVAAERADISVSEKQGLWLFESRGGCWRCHSGRNFSDEQFHNTGVSWGKEPLDLGRFEVTKKEEDKGKFKTPTLRGVAHSAPYMHDGSLATLEDVVELYSKGGGKNPNLERTLAPLNLTKDEAQNLVDFLKALSELPGESAVKSN
jgi:cytochrome c peroxidase